MNKHENDKTPLPLRIIAVGIFAAFWLWRVLAGALLGAFIGGILFVLLDQGTTAKISFFSFTLIGFVLGIFMAESSRRRARGAIPVFEGLYSSHDLDKKN